MCKIPTKEHRDYYAARELLKQAVSHLTNENILTLQFQSEEK